MPKTTPSAADTAAAARLAEQTAEAMYSRDAAISALPLSSCWRDGCVQAAIQIR